MNTHRLTVSLLSLGLFACGSDTDSDVRETSANEAQMDASAGSDGDDGETGEDTDEVSEEDAGDAQPSFEVPEFPGAVEPPGPVLPDVDPETPISDLDEDDFEKVCGTYVDVAEQTVGNLAELCGVSALNDAVEAEPETTEELRELCADRRAACEIEAAAAKTIVSTLSCTQTDECTATVEEFDACNAEMATVNAVYLKPLGSVEVPACDELTPALAQAIRLQLLAAILVAGSGSLDEEDTVDGGSASACDVLSAKCPEFAVPGGDNLPF